MGSFYNSLLNFKPAYKYILFGKYTFLYKLILIVLFVFLYLIYNVLFFLLLISVNIASFLSGVSLVWSSPILAILTDNENRFNIFGKAYGRNVTITDTDLSWIVSLLAIGGIFGALVFSFIVNSMSRRYSIKLLAIPYTLAYLLVLIEQPYIELFYISRVFMGIGISGTFSTIPIYVSEIAPAKDRGFLQALTTTTIMFGILFAYCIEPFVSLLTFNTIICVISILFGVFFGNSENSETPYYLMNKAYKNLGKIDGIDDKNMIRRIFNLLKHLYRYDDYETEDFSKNIKNNFNLDTFELLYDQKEYHLPILQDFKNIDSYVRTDYEERLYRTYQRDVALPFKNILVALSLLVFQQFSGISCVLSFAQQIFDTASGSIIPSEICVIIMALVQFVISLISPRFLDIVGRKPMLMFSIFGATVSHLIIGAYFYLLETNYVYINNLSFVPMIGLICFIIFYNCGIGSIPWIVAPEILPNNIKVYAMTIFNAIYWLFAFILLLSFNTLVETIGIGLLFIIFAFILVFFNVFVSLCVKETSGKTLSEIQSQQQKNHHLPLSSSSVFTSLSSPRIKV